MRPGYGAKSDTVWFTAPPADLRFACGPAWLAHVCGLDLGLAVAGERARQIHSDGAEYRALLFDARCRSYSPAFASRIALVSARSRCRRARLRCGQALRIYRRMAFRHRCLVRPESRKVWGRVNGPHGANDSAQLCLCGSCFAWIDCRTKTKLGWSIRHGGSDHQRDRPRRLLVRNAVALRRHHYSGRTIDRL